MNATATQPRKAAPPVRSLQYLPASQLLFLAAGGRSTGYRLEAIDRNTFALAKADGAEYEVYLDSGFSACSCKGFQYRGLKTKDGKGCKHLAALAKLREIGRI